MKKLIILSLFMLSLVSLMFAQGAEPRTVYQEIALSEVPPWTMTNYPTTDPHYLFHATYAGITFGTDSSMPEVSYFNVSYMEDLTCMVAQFDQAAWPVANTWVAGQTITMNVWYRSDIAVPFDTATMPTAQYVMTVPAGGDPIFNIPTLGLGTDVWTIPAGPNGTPDTWTYNLTVNGPAGTTVTGPGSYTGTLPQIFTCNTEVNDLLGNWVVGAPPAGMQWQTNTILVDATGWAGAKVDHVYSKTIEFVAVPPDTYTLNVNAVGPASLIYKNSVSTGQTTNYSFPGAAAADLIGTYTLEPLPAGWHWEPASIEVVAGHFVSGKSAVQVWGTMSNGAKVAYSHTINFMQIEDPIIPNIIPVTNPPAGVTITPMGFEDVDPSLVGLDTGLPWQGYTISAVDVWDVQVTNMYPGSDWYCWIQVGGALIAGPNPIPAATLTYTFVGVDFGAKGIVYAVVNDNETLPVELSSFSAVMTAEYFVQLNWTSQSETSLLGYRVLRNETADVSGAVSITPTLVTATNTSTTQNYTITDTEVENNTTYSYWLESVNMDGTSEFHGPVNVLVQHEVPPVLPEVTSMRNAYPNPFAQNGNTKIQVSVKAGENGTVTVYNILGQVVKTYTVREGLNDLNWNGKDSKGNTCGSGIYFYRLSTPSMNQTKKMVIVK